MKSRSRGGKPPRKIDKHWLDLKIENIRARLEGLKHRPRNGGLIPDWMRESHQRNLETELGYALHWRSQKD